MKRFLTDIAVLSIVISLFAACSNGETKKADAEPKKEVVKKEIAKKVEIKTIPISSQEFIKKYKLNMEEDALEIIDDTSPEPGKDKNAVHYDLNSKLDVGSDDFHIFQMAVDKRNGEIINISAFDSFGFDTFVTTLSALDIYHKPEVTDSIIEASKELETEGLTEKTVYVDRYKIEFAFSVLDMPTQNRFVISANPQ
jgi:hypothetical protein